VLGLHSVNNTVIAPASTGNNGNGNTAVTAKTHTNGTVPRIDETIQI
jgi:hypothetical protein